MTAILERTEENNLNQVVARLRVGQQWVWSNPHMDHRAAGMPRRVEIKKIDLPGYAVLVNREERPLHPNVFVDGSYSLAYHSDQSLKTPYHVAYRTMPAFSAQQPWAWLISRGIMPLFNAPEAPPAKMIGKRVYLYAGPVNDKAFVHVSEMKIDKYPKLTSEFETGVLIGSVVIDKAVDYWRSQWFVGPVAWILKDPIALPHTIKVDCPAQHGELWLPTIHR